MKFHVEPVSADVKVPPHPMEGPMPPEGGAHWIADQYTLRLIVDGVIRRVPDEGDAAPTEAPVPDADGPQGRRRALITRPDTAPAAPAPQEA